MHAKYVLATAMVLVWAAVAHAQYRERPHEHYWNRGLPPSFPAPGPRRAEPPDGPPVLHHVPLRARAGHETDGTICDDFDNDPDAAIAACGRIIARGPSRYGYGVVVAFTHRGQAYEDKGDREHAIADYSEAIRREPKVPGHFVMRGTTLEKSGDIEAAQRDFRQAVSLDPKNQEALNDLKRIETRSAVSVGGPAAPPPGPAAPSIPGGAAVPAIAAVATPAITSSAPAAAVTPSATIATAAAPVVRNSPPSDVAPPATTPVAAAQPAAPATSHGPRVALVIGNGAYVNANALPNPPNDAHAIAGTLRQIGFDVEEGENLDHAAMESLLHGFLHKAQNASVVLLFYAGHGMQVDGKNYLVPVDAKLAEPSDLAFETIEIDKLLDSLGDPGHTNIILLDACRDNPLARSFASHLPATRSAAVATGLAAYSAVGTGTLIAYATAPGQTALDGQGKDSPFTTSLLHFLPTPGMEIRQVLTRVRAEVASATGNKQIPWDNSSLMGDVVLVDPPAPAAKAAEH